MIVNKLSPSVNQPANQHPQSPPSGPTHNNRAAKHILCLWLPEWPIQRLVAAEPEFRHQHLVLFRIDSRKGKRVTAASPLARRAGVRTEMPINEANSLLRRATVPPTPKSDPKQQRDQSDQTALEFHISEHDPAADLTALQQLAETLEKFSPVIGIEQDLRQIESRKKAKTSTKANARFQPSSILLDVTGLSHLFGSYDVLASQVSQHCRRQDYHTRIAIANTIGLAWGASHFSRACQFDQPLIVSGNETKFTSDLPVAALRIDATTNNTLNRLGIETVGQLLAIDRGDLRSRLGQDLIRRMDQLSGVIEEPVIVSRKLPEFFENCVLQFPTSNRETIEAVINRLLARLCGELKSRQLGSLIWKVRLLPAQQSTGIDFRVCLFQATASADHVMPLMSMQLEQSLMAQDKRELNVNEIIVEVSSCVLLVQQQRQLFDENPRLDRQALAHLINRLSSRLGADNVVYPTFRSGAQPELSFEFRALVDPNRKRRRTKTTPTSHVLGRPLRLLTPPVGVSVKRETVPESEERALVFRKPVQIAFDSGVNRSTQNIVRSWGPERIETGWWRGTTVQRDYWSIVTEAGTQFWVFCDLKNGQWFVHGEF